VDWIEAVPLDKLLNGGGWAVAFWAVLYVARMVYRGKLVPERTHEAVVQALEIERRRNELLLEQLGNATDSLETVEAFVRALPQPSPIQVPNTQGRTLPPSVGRQRGGRAKRDRQPDGAWDEQWGGWNPPGDGAPGPGADDGR
jgi:hypothetical protein